MGTTSIIILAVIVIYLVMMIGIGLLYAKKSTDSDDYYLGGRTLGPWVTAMSAEASDMSSYLLMGLPGLAYLCGLAEVSWTVIGLAIGTYLNFLFVSKRLRRYSEKLGAITVPDYFSRRFGDKKHMLSLVAALVILIFFVPYTASGFKAVGTLFNSLFGWDYHVSMVVGAIVIILYTVLGGFMAVSTTDLIQSIVMTIALAIVLVFGISKAGGIGAVMDNAKNVPGFLSLFKGTLNSTAETPAADSFGFFRIVSTLAWGLGYFGMPHILLRFMAIRREEELKASRRIASIWVVLSMAVAVLIGIIGLALSSESLIPTLGTSSDSETVIVKISDFMSQNGILLTIASGIIMAGIVAATMSTADSQLLAASSSVAQDIAVDFLGIKLSEKVSMLLARGTVIVIAAIGIVLAWKPDSSVFRVVSFAWAGFGAAFGPVMLFSLFWKRVNKWGALAGMAAGGAMVFLWKFVISKLGGVFSVYELLPAFIVSCIAIVVVSLATRAPEKDVTDVFEQVAKKA